MTTQTTPGPNIYQRILAVMAELKYIQKGLKTVNNQYRFVSHDQVSAAIHPHLVKHGIVVLPTIKSWSQEGNRTSVEMVVHFVNTDNPQEQFAVSALGFGIDAGDKGPGKAVSYACKYALLKTFCLETGDDPDEDANAAYEPPICQDFADFSRNFEPIEINQILKFINETSEITKKHPEDIKREAMRRWTQFYKAFETWKKKGKE